MSRNKQENKTVSQQLLDSCRQALYNIKNSLDSITEEGLAKLAINDKLEASDRINKIIGGLGKSIETLSILEKKVEQEEIEEVKRRGGVKSSRYEE